ncbi:RER1 [Symbiodinium sp. CCMP2592]|nr:RER1 [Symbiodinium sp. CCMP2592]
MEETAEHARVPPMVQAQGILQQYLDETFVWVRVRWGAFATFLCMFLARIYITQGFFLVAYALGIYLLHLFQVYVAGDPDTNTEGEFRPFTRELSEFKCWWRGTRATGVALAMTFLSMFDVPVYWPILLAYLIFVLVLTIRKRVKYMIKQKHAPLAGIQALLAAS